MKNSEMVLYLCPELPYEKSSGGAHAHRYFIENISKIYENRLQIIGLTDKTPNIKSAYSLEKISNNLPSNYIKKLIDRIYRQLRWPLLPNKVTSRRTSQGLLKSREYLIKNKCKFIIIDHFDSLSLIDIGLIIRNKIPIVYIAHNIEKKLVEDLFKNAYPLSIKKLIYYIDIYRTSIHEALLMKHAHATIFLSRFDMNQSKEILKNSRVYCHIPGEKINNLQMAKGINHEINLLFSCNINFMPNRSALEWIAKELSSKILKINKSINIMVTGVTADKVPLEWRASNIKYKGFLNENDYKILLETVDAFLCPIQFGSGIKMKIIEALKFGLPVFATAESWRGLDKVGENYILPNSAEDAAAYIDKLSNSENLKIMQEEMIKRYNSLILDQASCEKIFSEISESLC